ncbi:hypothetical protein GF345_04225 [Candidatus Woesearchaeota archaeon]|nr:hypothetical protein [Candidatus Woesearchaeota archaeon]
MIKKGRKTNTKTLKGNGNGRISYKARSSSQKLGSFFAEEDEEESD